MRERRVVLLRWARLLVFPRGGDIFFFFCKVEDRVIGIVSIRVMSLLWVCRVVCEGAVACLCGYD